MKADQWRSQLKILIALQNEFEAQALKDELECLEHQVELCSGLKDGLSCLRDWRPDLLVTEESFDRSQPDSGLRLAEYSRVMGDQTNGWPGPQTLIFIAVADWDRFKRAQSTGAHVIVRGTTFEPAIRYVESVADDLVTDRVLGPALVGLHRFSGQSPHPQCENCEWVSASVSFGASQVDLHLSPVRIALLNVLLFRRRSQSAAAITEGCRESRFLKRILDGHNLRESAIKMEVSRLRNDLAKALQMMGAPYSGGLFLPQPPYGTKSYRLAGNRGLVHIPNV